MHALNSLTWHQLLRGVVATAAWAGSSAVTFAAGAHHAVDDAALVESGRCEVETWADRERGGGRALLHLGPACRVGPFELGMSLDRVRVSQEGSASTAGAQLKWAAPISPAWSVGLALSASWQQRSPRYLGTAVVLPLSWRASESVTVHLNAGRDLRAHASDDSRAGVALEWAPQEGWTLIAERFREGGGHFGRLGARWALTPAWSLDLSQARGLEAGAPRWWTLGLNWSLER